MNARRTKHIGLAEVNLLCRGGVLSGVRYLDAAWRVRDAAWWHSWALRALLVLGAGHLLAGIVFFFAYNWDDLPVVARFAVVQGGIAASALAAVITGLDRPLGGTLLIAASVLSGVLLAVTNQVYQTGADAWTVFATWALLILPWAVVSRNAAHWLVWLVVLYLGVYLYGVQVLIPAGRLSGTELLVALGLLSAVVLGAREMARQAGLARVAAPWTRTVVASTGLVLLFIPANGYVLGLGHEAIGLPVFLTAVAAVIGIYSTLLRDAVVVTVGIALTAFLLMSAGVRLLDEVIGLDWESTLRLLTGLGLLVLWCTVVTVSAVRLVFVLRRRLDGGGDA